MTKGRLVGANEKGKLNLAPGDYGRDLQDGHWYCCTPNGHFGNLENHDIKVNGDNTITVSPSILVVMDMEGGKTRELWHGYLRNGEWTSC